MDVLAELLCRVRDFLSEFKVYLKANTVKNAQIVICNTIS